MGPLFFTSACVIISICSLHFLPFHPIVSYTVSFIIASVFFLPAAYFLFRKELSSATVLMIIVIALLVRLSFITMTPVGSDDFFRYAWDGKVQAHSINPYAHAPASAELRHLATDNLPSLVTQPEMKTIYFPLSEWIFYAAYQLSGEHVWGFKLLLLIAEICTVYGLFLLMTLLDIPRRFVLFYLLCPMTFYEYAIDGHVDGFGLPLLIFSIYFYFSKRKFLSMVLLGFSLSIKPTALVLLPMYFFSEKDWRERVQILLIPVLTLAVHFAPYFVSANPFESLTAFTKNWTFNGFVFNALDSYFQHNQKSRLICALLLGIILLLLALSKKQLTDKIYYAVLFLLLFSPIVHPWYVGWLVVLLPIARKWSGLIYASTLSLTSVTYISYQLHGVWKEEPVVWIIEYLPVMLFVFLELRKEYAHNSGA